MNKVLKYIRTSNITETNNLIKAANMVVAENMGMDVRKKNANRSDRKEPWWKRRIQESIKTILKDISVLDRKAKGELRNQQKYKALSRKYHIARKGLKVVTEELKQRLIAKKAKLMRYDQRAKQYEQNRLYRVDQKRFYQEINGERTNEAVIPDSDESQKFWSDIWSNEIEHKKDAEWLQELKQPNTSPKQAEIKITVRDVKEISKKMSNWKSPGLDGVQGYWIKRFSECHTQIAEQLNNLLSDDQVIPEWLTKGRTVLCLKDIAKGNAVDNYRPISCLPLMWKLLTGIIAETMYGHLEENDILPEEQKGCKRKCRGTKDQLLIDKVILRDCKKRKTNLAMSWIDYRKAYDLIPHSWIMECLNLFGVASNVERLLKKSMEQWKTELTAYGNSLGSIAIKRGIFQGDSLSPLLFILCMIPLTMILRKAKAGYEFKGRQQPLIIHG